MVDITAGRGAGDGAGFPSLSDIGNVLRRGDIALALGLSERMHVGVVERKRGLQNTRPILGDVMEAVIGAIYLDGGFDAAQAFIQKHWADFLANPASAAKDAKTFVQEWALARGKVLPVYEVIGREGPEHRPEFTVRLLLGRHGGAEGKGPTKQAAEMVAAQQFIVTGALR